MGKYKNVDGEIFKDTEGYNGDYQVSNFGRIKSFKRYNNGKILKQNKDKDGYLRVKLYKNEKGKPKRINILLFETFNNYKLKENEIVHHINEIKSDNILDNFQLMINFEHQSLHKSGENHPMYGKTGEESGHHILKEQNVIQIWKLLIEGILTQKEIAEIFGVHQVTISDIKTGKTWKYII